MASQPQHPQRTTEVSCVPSGALTVRITDSEAHAKQAPSPQHQQYHDSTPNTTKDCNAGGARGSGGGGSTTKVDPLKPCAKYSISSSCSSGESGVRRTVLTKSHSQRRALPQLFERSAAQCWDPKFDSPILEEACRERCFPQTQRRFRYVLSYLACAALLWEVYFAVNYDRCDPATFLAPTASFLLFLLLLFLFTLTTAYAHLYNQASLLLIVATFTITLAPQIQTGGFADLERPREGNLSSRRIRDGVDPTLASCISPVGTFSLCMEVLLLLYSVLHVRLYASVLLGLLYSVLFEALGWLPLIQGRDGGGSDYGASGGAGGSLAYPGSPGSTNPEWDTLHWLGPAKALLHLCAHAIGIHLFIMSEVRSRSTFLKVGQAIMHGKDLEVEKALKERMIHSVMPRRVADELMKQGDEEMEGNAGKRYSAGACSASAVSTGGGPGGGSSIAASPKTHLHHHRKRKKTSIPRGQIIFRPFNMTRMEPVSILFADIVGFTKMSANKSAHALVGLLNDLFGRFDRLCELTRCEKISTLGDCYYCVAGCPEPRPDHAYCCVEMGLGMIVAIEQFCQETRETVDMRVGVHTGTVLCGILGIERFKFDVWSNDVNLANLMEQLGVAGKVHLSEHTAGFLDERYEREDGRVSERATQGLMEKLKGMKTYLISGRKLEHAQCGCSQDFLTPCPRPHTPDLIPGGAAGPCVTWSVIGDQNEEGAGLNGCQDEHKSNIAKFAPGRSPRALNGILSPPLEDPVRASQSSLCDMLQEKEKNTGAGTGTGTSLGVGGPGGSGPGGMDHSALIPIRSKNFREKSDVHFVDVIKEDSLMKDYFFKPPINKLSLNFLERPLETAYRISYQEEVETQAPVQTFASPTFSSFLDVLLSCSVFLALTLACFLVTLGVMETLPATALGLAAVAGLLELVSLVLSIRMAFYLDNVMSCTRTLLRVASGWLSRHVIGAVLVSLPAVSVFSHLACSLHPPIQVTMFLCCAVTIAIIQYCNFCQLSFWMRSALATAAGVALLVLLYSPLNRTSNLTNLTSVARSTQRESGPDSIPTVPVTLLNLLVPEAVLAYFLLLLLVWVLNREFEVSYRLHYHGNVEADKHRDNIQTMRDQADWLLGNIIPFHVSEQLKVTQSYSKNHDNAGVIFASIVNFSEFYEESYEGGKECYRVLNELIGDFDELLRKPDFANVEKIKTIGATYMAASGLNAQQCVDDSHPHSNHLRALFDFALEMMGVLDDFNKNMLGFGFKLRIGFNHGPLTAGVIGTTKLLYDIWGDTVNIASRMDSTGVECRVQVSEESHTALSGLGLEFDYRGTVNVKGKGEMRTFLYPRSADSGGQLLTEPGLRSQLAFGPKGPGDVPIKTGPNAGTDVPALCPSSSSRSPPPISSTHTPEHSSLGPLGAPGLGHEPGVANPSGPRGGWVTPTGSPHTWAGLLPHPLTLDVDPELVPCSLARPEEEEEDEEEEEGANELTKLNKEDFTSRL
ncbi:adenylate cyclase type 9 isoform X2 [Esox lucius]|uniref:adenylate cyclase n=1 Tax=Esox lucius TaxID=8010 RepID=A0A3P9AJZ1_ESOLU|nr:adenylate cyclase type 9 isoform X2 [Esox lucius]